MKIVGLCGRAGAGKSSVVAIVKQRFPNVQAISTGDATRRLLRSQGIGISHHNLQAITKQILADRGDDFISFIFDLVDPQYEITLFDSFRRVQDVACVTKTFGAPVIVGVSAPEELRFKRLQARSRPSDPPNQVAFNELTMLENSWGVEDVCRLAEAHIVNTGSYTELCEQAMIILKEIFQSQIGSTYV